MHPEGFKYLVIRKAPGMRQYSLVPGMVTAWRGGPLPSYLAMVVGYLSNVRYTDDRGCRGMRTACLPDRGSQETIEEV